MLTALAISNYRTLRDLVLPLDRLNLVTGANGSGKSNLYRALRLLADTAQGRVVQSLAREGGLGSTLWAGPEQIARSVHQGDHRVEGTRRTKAVSLGLGFAADDYSYLIDLGLPQSGTPAPDVPSLFGGDPEIKQERIWHGPTRRPSTAIAERRGAYVKIRGEAGDWIGMEKPLATYDSVMAEVADPRNAPEVMLLRDTIRAWRFYDHFRTDSDAPARLPQIGTRTPVLANDGADLAAALQTIREVGDRAGLAAAIDDAFPGSQLSIVANQDGRFSLAMRQLGLLRPLAAAELSDGTLRYLLWIAALMTPRPPALMVLNEPETSLHPDLFPALARLIARAAEHSQTIVVSHAPKLIASLSNEPGCRSIELVKTFGETKIVGQGIIGQAPWKWPGR